MPDTTRRSLAAALLAAASPAFGQAPKDSAVRIAEIALRASDGQPVLPDAPKARATYIDFWASWCAPCKLSFPWMNQLHDQLAGQGLRIVAINLDRKDADAQRFLQQNPTRFPVAFDPGAELATRLNIQAMPTSLLVGADRSVLLTHRGFKLEDRAELEARLRAALK